MELKLKNKVVLITGSSHGIGKAIAKSFHDEGCIVILNGRDEKKLVDIKNTLKERVDYVVADVTKPDDCEKMINQIISDHKKLDILICNVGLSKSVKPGLEDSLEWKKILDANFFSTIHMVKASEKILEKTSGSIVCISSIAGMNILNDAPITYSTAKAALNFYIQGISRPLASKGIKINGVAPGNIIFENSVWQRKIEENEENVKKILENEVAMKRLGNPEEIADFVVFVASPKNSFSTGSICVVDGGQIR
jgi:3-oxoacyl-[acyl-carrier protein] reductase